MPPPLATPLTLRAPAGPVPLETNLLLAPIAGWCELAWRLTVRECGGVGLACTDLLSPQGLLCSSETSYDLARTHDLDQPIGMQLYGADPQILADGARWCADHGATVVDINMGCPVDKVCKKDGGSKLMCNLPNTFRAFEAVRAALPDRIPLTAKMRLGWDEAAYEAGVACDLAVGLCERGASMITVHGRTTEQLFRGQCRREGIKRVVEAVGEATGTYDGAPNGGVPVVGNGDVRTAQDAVDMITETGCAGAMIGRGSFGNPWIFAEAWALQKKKGLATRDQPLGMISSSLVASGQSPVPSDSARLDTVLAYFHRMIDFRGEHHAMHVIRQKISWLGKTINDGHCKPLKEAVRNARTPDEVRAAIEAWRGGELRKDAIESLANEPRASATGS
ncbi:MAG: tRNA-dihydrouridine synthase family protein [Phycisphaerales bacterium]|nr:tRNA-dihydrouridine synthase family protein [Planctomycetota bacterium]MCH8509175.1 tRNA-dihydrouridine synthase family protein [Phycisphaerales bacterium]